MAVKICLLLLACATLGLAQILGNLPGPALGPIYVLQKFIPSNLNAADRGAVAQRLNISNVVRYPSGLGEEPIVHYEWQNYDGWYNNPAHPEWGGAGKT